MIQAEERLLLKKTLKEIDDELKKIERVTK